MSNITVTMIVRDSEKTLERALLSIKPLNPQIVILDTGSKDNTMSIAKKYTNFVFEKTWVDDFSVARNETLQYVSNDWIMYLDSDEWLHDSAPAKILSIVNQERPEFPFYSFELHQGPMRLPQVRLWHKSRGAKWYRPVHELLLPNAPRGVKEDIVVYHESRPEELSSSKRNITILKKAMDEDPHDPLNHFYLSVEYNIVQEYDKSVYHGLKFLVTDQNVMLGRKMYIKYVLAWTYAWKKQEAKLAIKNCIEALAVNICIPEFWCVLGDVYLNLFRKIPQARCFYRNAIHFGKYHPKGMWLRDLEKSSVYPEHMIKKCDVLESSKISRTTHPEYFGPIIPKK